MAKLKRASLIDRINPLGTRTLERALEFCALRGNPNVEIQHWLTQIFAEPDSDLHRILRGYSDEVNLTRLLSDIAESLNRLPRWSSPRMDLSEQLMEVLQRAWAFGVLMFDEPRIRTGHLLVAMTSVPDLRSQLLGISSQFKGISADALTDGFASLVAGSPEAPTAAERAAGAAGEAASHGADGPVAPAAMGKQQALARFSVDLTAAARTGDMDPIVGRDAEIRQIVDILMRRRQNNPILTGEAGVGKTAVVEGFAQRIVAGDVPPPLRNITLRTLDLGLLSAGAGVKGEFENRLRQVIEEVQQSPTPIILFIDEAHTLIGAGGQAGQGDAANLLKPALARGKLRTIAATTWAEYKKYFEKDPALTRRFQVVKVDEPTEERALQMMRGVASHLERHHRVQILDEAMEASVRLSARYIPERQLPDKCVSLLDTACARVAVGHHAVPPEVEDTRRAIAQLELEQGILERETAVGADHADRKTDLIGRLASQKDRLPSLEARWSQERDLVTQILTSRAKLRGAEPGNIDSTPTLTLAAAPPVVPSQAAAAEAMTPAQRAAKCKELRALESRLAEVQGDRPLILPSVDRQAVATVVEGWTGIPVGRMVKNDIDAVLHLADAMEKRVIGQRHALHAIAKRIQTSRAGLDNPSRPIGVFLLVGPSGVGKTETALALGELFYGGEQSVIPINMSEFQESHTVSTLKGAPPGYVGYGEGGRLTEAVRRRPYSVVLLDEIEKAHPDVHELFFQVFDKGKMEDGEGREIDFKNTIILMTSNAGTALIDNMCQGPLMPTPEELAASLRSALLEVFPAALLGRMVVVPYFPISAEMLQSIIRLQLERIENRVASVHRLPFTYDPSVIELVASRCTETESGARAVDAILTHTVLPQISREYLTRMSGGEAMKRIHVSVNDGQLQYAFD